MFDDFETEVQSDEMYDDLLLEMYMASSILEEEEGNLEDDIYQLDMFEMM